MTINNQLSISAESLNPHAVYKLHVCASINVYMKICAKPKLQLN